MKARGQINGFMTMTPERRIEVATAAGKIGGLIQRDLKLGIHAHTPEQIAAVARMGGFASCEVNGWKDSATQAANGRRGGPKNKGFKWCNNGVSELKYTATQQIAEPFEAFIARSGFLIGRMRRAA